MPLGTRTVKLLNDYDIVVARQNAREMARELGFGLIDQTRIATAVSEVARQALINQGGGLLMLTAITKGSRQGLECSCVGSKWVETALQSSQEGILGGVNRLVDEFVLEAGEGDQVSIIMRKWKP